MNADARPLHRRQRRGRAPCDGSGQKRGRRTATDGRGASDETSLLARTTARALVALGASLAHDLRDADGATRAMLRRAAFRMAASRQEALPTSGPPEDDPQVIDVTPDEVEDAD